MEILREVQTNSEHDTIDFGIQLANDFKEKDIVCIFGDLGAGKTCLIKGIVKGRGIQCEYVRSPTFAILNEYKGEIPVYHLDFYRIETLNEMEDIGIEEFCGEKGITLIEWPEKILSYLPQNKNIWEIKIDILGETKRKFTLSMIESLPKPARGRNQIGLPPC